MTIRESIRQQHQTVKALSPKEKLAYFREYYALPTICILCVVIAVISFIISSAAKKEDAYFAIFFGASPQEGSAEFLESFAQQAQIDTDRSAITIQTSLDIRIKDQISEETYAAMQYFVTTIAAQMVDSFAADKDVFLYYGYMGYAIDLREQLTEAQLLQLGPYLHYIDGEILRAQENSNEGLVFEYGQWPDSQNPDAMADPIPVGIDIAAATESFRSSYTFAGKQPMIGICPGSQHPDATLSFLTFIFDLS